MSLSIAIECRHCGCEIASADPTYNLAPMWKAAGFDHREWWGEPSAVDFAIMLDSVLSELKAYPDKYIAMNPPNGWGNYPGLVEAFDKLAVRLAEVPDARVTVTG